ncbi:MAG: hypothetical protein LQ346_002202 [Caloplaca aetnensis]|nr:MAG: hypothetical protein LQ346_002202 [Caloplaca aetnensis]
MALFSPIKLGRTQLSHRLVMAPLTRIRAEDDHVPTAMALEYYSQRASVRGTFIISEGTLLNPEAISWLNIPMIYSRQQIAAWKRITDAVHAKGSYIYCQLFTAGREVSAEVLKVTGTELRSSSVVPMEAGGAVPRAMTEDEIWDAVSQFVQAARNAIEAGFDGVEIHGANGYLIDQFTQDTCNKRTDRWGGNIENRARFMVEITRAVVAAIGADRVGVRLSPFSTFQGMGMADPIPQFSYLIKRLKEYKLAYVHLVESRVSGGSDAPGTEKVNFAVDIWDNTSLVLIAGGYTPDSAKRAVETEYRGKDVLVVFGRHFISNPDLPFRIQRGIALEPYNRGTFYTTKSPIGYVDYPFSEEFVREKATVTKVSGTNASMVAA